MTPKMLVIAPHPDDEILGVGGTMARFAAAGGAITVLTVGAHAPPLYAEGVRERCIAQAREAHALLRIKQSLFFDYPAVFINQVPVHELNGKIASVVREVEPEIVLVPYYDRHVDHRAVFDAAMVVTRPVGDGRRMKLVAAYETISETHWNAPGVEPNFVPNWCVDITDSIDSKVAALECFPEQVHPFPGPRSLEAVRALALFRGSQAGFGYGEAFHILRMSAAPEALFPQPK